MDFSSCLTSTQVFHIGFNVTNGSLDAIIMTVGIRSAHCQPGGYRQGGCPQRHWLHLGRPFTRLNGQQALISWSATMFEYLMPRLMVRSEPGLCWVKPWKWLRATDRIWSRKKRPWGSRNRDIIALTPTNSINIAPSGCRVRLQARFSG